MKMVSFGKVTRIRGSIARIDTPFLRTHISNTKQFVEGEIVVALREEGERKTEVMEFEEFYNSYIENGSDKVKRTFDNTTSKMSTALKTFFFI